MPGFVQYEGECLALNLLCRASHTLFSNLVARTQKRQGQMDMLG